MHAGNRNLHSIANYECPKDDEIKVIARQVLEALEYIHSKGMMHGDVKMLNITRFGHENRLRLVDFDASCAIDYCTSYTGAKFSSSCLPPEMIYRLQGTTEIDKFETYWQLPTVEYRL